jgi:hypothetical protein
MAKRLASAPARLEKKNERIINQGDFDDDEVKPQASVGRIGAIPMCWHSQHWQCSKYATDSSEVYRCSAMRRQW